MNIKVFSNDSIYDLERQINKFLGKHKDIELIDVKYNITITKENYDIAAMIIYKEPKQ